jgi:CoA:oxalate CoA-transferase
MEATSSPGPLSGIVVADLTRVLAGPYCTLLLADLGARVIKIEAPDGGDDARHMGPFVDEQSMYFLSANRGKESIALNLKSAEDRVIFEQILAGSDVLVENFRPGTMARLGYAPEELRKKFPKLVLASISGFGQTGPDSAKPAYDLIVQALGGIMSITGEVGRSPVRVGTSIGDIAAGLFGALAISSALLHREKTGEALPVDVAMLDCQIALLENAVARHTSTGEVPEPTGTRHPSITPFEAFQTADGNIVVAAGNDALFERLCVAIGIPEIPTQPEFRSNVARTRNAEAVRQLVGAALAGESTSHWLEVITAAGVPCARINNIAQAIRMPQVEARGMLADVQLKSGRTIQVAGNPMKFGGVADPRIRQPAPELDEHRTDILTEFSR